MPAVAVEEVVKQERVFRVAQGQEDKVTPVVRQVLVLSMVQAAAGELAE